MLSIVVQGAVFQGNLIETAVHCRHWRRLFPHAEIVLVVSVTDVFQRTVDHGAYPDLRLIRRHEHDGYLQAAVATIVENCDRVALAGSALPLPPIKRDTPKPNNMNFQIAAARMGLSLIRGRYVLRVRSDLVFMDRTFLEQWEEALPVVRGGFSMFRERVLISWLYTLNPYSVERMPLHFSDWFHFGLAEDVRHIWDVPEIELHDALYYRTHPHDPNSNTRERLFNIRLAVEQHLYLSCFKKRFPDLALDYHNDPRAITRSLDILIDNFAICDLVQARCLFEKYAHEFHDEAKHSHCLTRAAWQRIADARGEDYKALLAHEASDRTADDASPPECGFSRTYGTSRLKSRVGRVENGQIVSTGADGVLFYGPYVSLPPGRYVAVVHTSLESPGSMVLRVTLDGGNTVIAQRTISTRRRGGGKARDLTIPFEMPNRDSADVEVVCSIKGFRGLAVSGITISKRGSQAGTLFFGAMRAMRSTIRRRRRSAVA